MLDIKSNYISTEDYHKYIAAARIVSDVVHEPYGGKIEEGKDYYDFWCNTSKEELQEALDFLNELKEYLPTNKELYGEGY